MPEGASTSQKRSDRYSSGKFKMFIVHRFITKTNLDNFLLFDCLEETERTSE